MSTAEVKTLSEAIEVSLTALRRLDTDDLVMVRQAVRIAADADRLVLACVRQARTGGHPWSQVAAELATSTSRAQHQLVAADGASPRR